MIKINQINQKKQKIIGLSILIAIGLIIFGSYEVNLGRITLNNNMSNSTYEIYIYIIIKGILNILSGLLLVINNLILYCIEPSTIETTNNITIKGTIVNCCLFINTGVTIWGLIRYTNQTFYETIEISSFQQILYIEFILFLINSAITSIIIICGCCTICLYINKSNKPINNLNNVDIKINNIIT